MHWIFQPLRTHVNIFCKKIIYTCRDPSIVNRTLRYLAHYKLFHYFKVSILIQYKILMICHCSLRSFRASELWKTTVVPSASGIFKKLRCMMLSRVCTLDWHIVNLSTQTLNTPLSRYYSNCYVFCKFFMKDGNHSDAFIEYFNCHFACWRWKIDK